MSLPSWRNGSAKQSLVAFLQEITQGPGALPVADRVAAFDNDGTLACEKPHTALAGFLLDRPVRVRPFTGDQAPVPGQQRSRRNQAALSPASEMGPAVRHDLGATWPGYVSIMVWLGLGSSTGGGAGRWRRR